MMHPLTREEGQGVIESIFVLFIAIFVFFALTKFFLNTTEKIVTEIQILDLLENGAIKWNDKFITHRVDGSREVNEDDINAEVTFDKFAVTKDEEKMEKEGLFNGRVTETQ